MRRVTTKSERKLVEIWIFLSDDSAVRFIHNPFYFRNHRCALEVVELATPVGLILIGLIIRAIFGAVIVAVVALLLWKASKVLDAYAEKLKTQSKAGSA